MMIKSGANESDINTIRRLAAEGKTAQQISTELKIVEECVKSFMPKIAPPKEAVKKE